MTASATPRRATVLGIGSVLMGDDAAGPWVIQLLEAHWEFPDGVTVLDAGTPGPELNHLLLGLDALIVVDTVKAAQPPGTLKLYRRDQILRAPASPRLTPHQPGLRDALLTGDFADEGPRDVVLIGVVPGEVELGTALSPAVQAALGEAEAAVVAELTALGLAPTRRSEPAEPRPWWLEAGGAPA
jgi:hydrogenase maturation protease